MARIRTIKPEFPHSQSMGRVSRESRLCFMLLWTLADDAGRLRGDSRMLASLLYPYDDGEEGHIRTSRSDLDRWLGELEEEGCIRRYENDGSQYVEIRNWLKHQKIDKPSKSKLPGPDDEGSRILANVREVSSGDLDLDLDRDQGKDQEIPSESLSASPTDVPRGTAADGDQTGQIVARVFSHWRETWNHPRAKLDAKRRQRIREALKLGYSEADLCQCISGYRNSPHHMGRNERNTVFDDLELFLRDAKHIDAGLKFYAQPPRRELSEKTLRIVDQTDGWVPPELRMNA